MKKDEKKTQIFTEKRTGFSKRNTTTISPSKISKNPKMWEKPNFTYKISCSFSKRKLCTKKQGSICMQTPPFI